MHPDDRENRREESACKHITDYVGAVLGGRYKELRT